MRRYFKMALRLFEAWILGSAVHHAMLGVIPFLSTEAGQPWQNVTGLLSMLAVFLINPFKII